MRLSAIGMNREMFDNISAINQKLRRLNPYDATSQSGLFLQQRNRDSVSISGQGKKATIVQQLLSQKQIIQESKNVEMQRGLKEGYINEEKLAEYDKQLEMIDRQIVEATTKQSMEEYKDKSAHTSTKVMTEEEYEQRKVKDMMSAASGIDRIETISSIKEKIDGQVCVLKAEIKTDGSKALESKREYVQELEARSKDLLKQVGTEMADINRSINKDVHINHVEENHKEEGERIIYTGAITTIEENSGSEEILFDDNRASL